MYGLGRMEKGKSLAAPRAVIGSRPCAKGEKDIFALRTNHRAWCSNTFPGESTSKPFGFEISGGIVRIGKMMVSKTIEIRQYGCYHIVVMRKQHQYAY